MDARRLGPGSTIDANYRADWDHCELDHFWGAGRIAMIAHHRWVLIVR